MVEYYLVGPQPCGHDVIALEEFGGEVDDHPGAAIRVEGRLRVQVLMPKSVHAAGPATYEQYQATVRELALEYDFSERHFHGQVDIVWNPSTDGLALRNEPPGEQVDRVL